MALRGSLTDFSLPDVFQLITFSRKTGVLRIRSGVDASGAVWFRDGEVFFAQSNWHHEPLGERLVAARKITPSALEKALGIRAAEPDGGRRLGQVLVDEGYITEKVLEAFVQEQIQDTIFDLMRWESGEFDFELLPEVVDEDIGLTVSIENVIMEGSRRLDEWARIKKKVPSMDVVFKMATAPGEGTFEISLKPVEWSLLLLVDGTRSVAELARATGRTDFEVARILYGLFSAGLLEFAVEETATPPAELPAAPEPETGPESALAEEFPVESEPGPEHAPEPESDLIFLPPEPVPADDMLVEVEAMTEEPPAPVIEAEHELLEADVVPQAAPAPETRPEPEVPGFLAGPAPVVEPTDDVTSFAEMMGVTFGPVEEKSHAEPAPAEPAPEPGVESAAREGTLEPWAPEGTEPEAVTPEPEPQFEEHQLESGPEIERAAAEPETVAELRPELETRAEEPDFSELLESLESLEEPTEEVAADEAAGGFVPRAADVETVVPESPPALLNERVEELGADLSEMTDEIGALTGGRTSRPQVNVTSIPERDQGTALKRDEAVDKTLVLKIIDGLRKL